MQLEKGGWVRVVLLLEALAAQGTNCSLADLQEIVVTSDKRRFTLDGGRIRANQGHSVAVDLELTPSNPPETLFHGTYPGALGSIRKKGLQKGERHHVHLSEDIECALQVGSRRGVPQLLQIDAARMAADGHKFYRSENGVWLVDEVRPEYLKEEE